MKRSVPEGKSRIGKKFYRTVIEIEVLSEEPVSFSELDEIHYAITQGHCSGDWIVNSQSEVTPKHMAQLLIAQGSDPEFLGLDEDGNIMGDEV
jgi:hypothetical protein